MDLHTLGITELEGTPVPRLITIPPTEPGECFEIVLANGHPMLVPLDEAIPSLLSAPRLIICDSAGEHGKITAAALLD